MSDKYRDLGIEVGTVFRGRYEILHTLSRGGFGMVFKGRQLSTGQNVAIKCLYRQGTNADDHARQLARFRREMKLCAQLHHPHIVRLIDSGTSEDDILFTVFEFVPGQTLAQLLADNERLPPVEAGRLMGQVLDALACAHGLGIIHRDLKPGNIMVVQTGTRKNAMILDFGISAITTWHERDDASDLTDPSERLGTPAYAAPEQLQGRQVTVASDLYAWGLVFVECLTGRRAIPGATVGEIIDAQLSSQPIAIPVGLNGHPLARLLRLVTTKRARNRQLSASDVFELLDACDLTGLGDDALGSDAQAPGLAMENTSPAHTTSQRLKRPVDPHGSTLGYTLTGPLVRSSTASSHPGRRAPTQGERRQITAVTYAFHIESSSESPRPEGGALDLEQSAELLFACKELCRAAVRESGGHIASDFGRRVVAFYGHPVARADDADRAVRTAVTVMREVRDDGGAQADRQADLRIGLGVGVATGLVIARGRDLPDEPDDILGDPPEVALALSRTARAGQVLITTATRALLRQQLSYGHSALRRLPGWHAPVEFCTAMEPSADDGPTTTDNDGDSRGAAAHARPMVGRTEELALLLRSWNGARAGAGGAYLVSGDAGIGKSRLLAAMRAKMAAHQCIQLLCACTTTGHNSALLPIIELLAQHLKLHGATDNRDKLERVRVLLECYGLDPLEAMPLVAPLLAVEIVAPYAPVTLAPGLRRERTMRALITLIMSMTEERPVLFVVEDLHWADPTTIELLTSLLEEAPMSGLLVVLTARREFESPWTAEQIATVHLRGLGRDSTEALIAQAADGRALPEQVINDVVRRTDGVPLFIEELIRSLLDSGTLRADGFRYVLDRPELQPDIPATLRDLLMARIDRLETGRETILLAAVMGREFSFKQICAIAGLGEGLVRALLQELLAAELLHRRRRLSDDIYSFRHALIQETAYDSLPRATRQQYHRQIVDILEQRFPELVKSRPELLAHHHAGANQIRPAIDYALRAGRLALQRSANMEALGHARDALAWVPTLADERERAERELDVNGVMRPALMASYGNSSPEFRARIERAEQLIDKLGDGPYVYTALISMQGYYAVSGQYERAARVGARYQARAQRFRDPAHLIIAATQVGMTAFHLGEFQKTRENMFAIVRLFDPDLHGELVHKLGVDPSAAAHGYLAVTLWNLGFPDQAVWHATRAVARAERLKHTVSIIAALSFQAQLEHARADREAARRITKRMIQMSDRHGFSVWQDISRSLHCWAESDVEGGERALARFVDFGYELRRVYWTSMIAESLAAAGRTDEALQRLAECEELAEATGERSRQAAIRWLRGSYLMRTGAGHEEQVEEYLRAAIDLAQHQQAKMFELQASTALCRLLCRRGRVQEGLRRLRTIFAWFTEGLDTAPLQSARGLLEAWSFVEVELEPVADHS